MIAAGLALFSVISMLSVSAQAASGIQAKGQEVKPPVKASLPKEVAALIQEGLATRQGRQDIPFSFFKQLVLIAKGGLFPVFIFKAKNGDLGYTPSSSGSGEMETMLTVFYQFFLVDNAGMLKPTMGGKSPALLKTEGAGYDPEKEDWYSFGTGLQVGKYALALVLATPDMKKMSVAYADTVVPGPESYQTTIWPTEPVLLKSMQAIDPDQRPTIHRGYLSYGGAMIVANVMGNVATDELLDILFYVLGAAVKDPAAVRPVNDLEVTFEVQGEDGKAAIKWAPQSYDSFAITQQLPLIQTLQIKDDKGERIEKRPLPAGKYVLLANVMDKVSGMKGETKVGFEVK
ncbi:MAG: hypothetical protein A2Y70_08055 [Candidatus Aminicenantes bacterium RBG_13_64_14]|nr:MAG: hypothetical protein A2Y70_08055 [Candidatus Aminicenantes bacterium RBG_13_64_14]